MNYEQFLLLKLAEECVEVAQRCSKQMQFGKDEIQPGQNKSNCRRLLDELNDLIAVVDLLLEAGEIPTNSVPQLEKAIAEKKRKIEKYLEYSKELGKVEAEINDRRYS